ncbi:MAG: ribosomal-protein-alanine N-acetyltransferase, partial [Spirochaetes bacterium]
IISLAVHPEYRGKGHGKKLIEELVRIMDAGIIELQVRRSNTEALKFYQSVGFERKGILPAYYGDGEDAVVMFMKKG